MKKLAALTICTKSHIPNAMAAMDSMCKNSSADLDFIILVADLYKNFDIEEYQIYRLSNFVKEYEFFSIKYGYYSDETRWSLKPYALIRALSIYEKVIYVDPDTYFVGDVSKIFDEIDGVLLTPHFRQYFLNKDINELLFTHGYFNAGFVGCSNYGESIEALKWWGECCRARCEKNACVGLHDDQKYLDFMYVEFDCVKKTKNKGMNIAGWNITDYKFVNGKIQNEYEPIFFHFSPSSDGCGVPEYQENLRAYKKSCDELRSELRSIFPN